MPAAATTVGKEAAAPGVVSRLAWYSLLLCVAVIPLVTSIGFGGGSSWSATVDPYHVPKLLALSLILSFATAAWAIDVTLFRRPVRGGKVLYLVGLFALLVAASTVFAREPLSSLFGASGLSTGAVTWLLCMWLGVLLTQYLTTTNSLRSLSWAVAGGGAAVAAIALLQALGVDPLSTPTITETEWMVYQGMATLGNPNFTALVLTGPAIVALALARSAAGTARWIGAVAATMMVAAIFFTVTRAAWLGVAVATGVFLFMTSEDRSEFLKRAGRYGGIALVLAVVGTFIATADTIFYRFARITQDFDFFTSGRLTLWADTLRVIAKYPLLGTGADRLPIGGYEVQTAVEYTQSGQRLMMQDPHSLPLLIAGSFGLPAMLVLATLAAVAVRGGLQRLKTRSSAPSFTLYAGWVAALIGLLLAALLSVWTITAVLALFVTVGAVLAPTLKRAQLPAAAAAALVAVALAVVGVSTWGAIRSASSARHVALVATGSPQTHFDEAMRLTPWDAKTRTDYLWAKISSYRGVLGGSDANASQQLAAELDKEVLLAIGDFPEELLLYRLRIDLYRASQGSPGYAPDMVRQAIDDALAAFPNDPEFTKWRAEFASAQ